jgi:bacterioferritin (cytochrome b1)
MRMTLEEALTAALDDEYRARATYRAVLDAHGDVRPFVNIVESEERHIQALCRLCERYDVKVPRDPWPDRVSAPASLEAACEASLETERENAALYEKLLEAAAGHPDVEETFRRLGTASQENHMPALQRALERERGGRGGSHGRGRVRRRRRRGRGIGSAEDDL